ncbi:chitin deacetylase [Phlyctochytrium bullatum]|nr:chitin deacetylase [Phlyctochytrium bullatum]
MLSSAAAIGVLAVATVAILPSAVLSQSTTAIPPPKSSPAPCNDPNYPPCNPVELASPNKWGDSYKIPEPSPVPAWVSFVKSRANPDYPFEDKAVNPNGTYWSSGMPNAKGVVWGNPDNVATELYDDGPDQFNPDFINLLRTYNARATFFVLGAAVVRNPAHKASLKAAYDAGHQIAWTHNKNTAQSTDVLISEIILTSKAIYDVIGKVPRYYRNPYGDTDDRVRNLIVAFGMRTALWNIVANDTDFFVGLDDDRLFTTRNNTRVINQQVWSALNITDRFRATLETGVQPALDAVINPALNWVPNNPAVVRSGGSPYGPYVGFISLEHELLQIQLEAARLVIPMVLNGTAATMTIAPGRLGPVTATASATQAATTFTVNVTPQRRYRPVTVAECDGDANGAYFDDNHPFVQFIRNIKLPLTDADYNPPVTTTSGAATGGATGTGSQSGGATATGSGSGSTNGATVSTTTTKSGAAASNGWFAAAFVGALVAAVAGAML